MADVWLMIFAIAMLANAYCMVRFWRALQAFEKSQRELNELLERARKS